MTIWTKFTHEPSKEIYDVKLDTGHIIPRLQRAADGNFYRGKLCIKAEYVREIRVFDESNKD